MKILVIRNGGIGDTLLLVPLLQAIKQEFTPLELAAMGREDVLAILARERIIDKFIPFEQDGIWKLYGEIEALPQQLSNLLSSFDMIFSLIVDKDGCFEGNLKKSGCGKVLTAPPLPPENWTGHASGYYAEAFSLAPFPSLDQVRPFEIREEDRAVAGHFSRAHCVDFTRDNAVAIHPGSGSKNKNWPMENFREAAGLLAERGNKVLWIASPAEEERGVPMRQEMKNIIRVQLPLGRLGSLLKFCSAYIGNDSGISHLAGLAGIPSVVIFGPTSPDSWAPLGPKARPLWKRLECQPCAPETRQRCEGRECLSLISVDEAVSGLIGFDER
ncbi:MAG: glycosyltransferase family 9 protein [Nitrospinae bacterium]|nr:glycosyltransferase family 9 protein [Nitrospinota bacterium]